LEIKRNHCKAKNVVQINTKINLSREHTEQMQIQKIFTRCNITR